MKVVLYGWSVIGIMMITVLCDVSHAREESGASLKPFGMAMYRLRYDVTAGRTGDIWRSGGDYSNWIGYRVGIAATINDQLSGRFEIGNNWFGAEKVSGIRYNYDFQSNPRGLFPFFTLAYCEWNPQYLHIQAGIVPVTGEAVKKLLGVSLVSGGKGYACASHVPWGAVTNNGMQGLRIGAPVVLGSIKTGVDFFTTILTQRTAGTASSFRTNSDAILFMLELPAVYGNISLVPQLMVLPNRNYDAKTDKSDHEFMGGFDGSYKINRNISLSLGYGVAWFPQNAAGDSTGMIRKQLGMNGGAGASMKIGPGKLELLFALSTDEDLEKQKSRTLYPYADIKYGWNVNGSFVIMPHLRMYVTDHNNNDLTVISRPEMVFMGSF